MAYADAELPTGTANDARVRLGGHVQPPVKGFGAVQVPPLSAPSSPAPPRWYADTKASLPIAGEVQMPSVSADLMHSVPRLLMFRAVLELAGRNAKDVISDTFCSRVGAGQRHCLICGWLRWQRARLESSAAGQLGTDATKPES